MNKDKELEAKMLKKQLELLEGIEENWDNIDWAKTFNVPPAKEGESLLQYFRRTLYK